MNKLIKGSIAGAAGIALLLGGAGTLAVWNDTASLASAGSITSGTLDITAGTGAWDASPALIVPGDTLTYSSTLTLSATGDNLKFQLSSNIPSIITLATIDGATVTPTFVVKRDGTAVAPDGSGVYTVIAAGAYTVDATIVVDFLEGTSGLTGQGDTLDLSTAAVTVTQVAP